MFAVVVRESGDAEQIEQSGDLVSARVAPRVRQAPGFVSAMWMSDGSGGTLNVIAFYVGGRGSSRARSREDVASPTVHEGRAGRAVPRPRDRVGVRLVIMPGHAGRQGVG